MSDRLVVLLDTYVLSDLAKASLGLPRLTKAYVRRGRAALDFFTSLVDSRVAIFPTSWVLEAETGLREEPEFEKAVSQIAARLSRGVAFHDPTRMLSNQMRRVFVSYLNGTDYSPAWEEGFPLDPRAAIPRKLEELASHRHTRTSDEERARRQELKRLFVEYHQERAAATGRSPSSFESLRTANAREYVRLFVTDPFRRVVLGESLGFTDTVLKDTALGLMLAARERGLDAVKAALRVGDFLLSESVLKTPLIDIRASIEASIEFDEKSRGWEPGDEYDLNALSQVLPYCDAVFCDRNMKGILRRRRIHSRYHTAVYCMGDFDQFRRHVEDGPAGPLDTMDPRLAPIAERWDRVTEYLVNVARAVHREKWDDPCPYPGWSNKDLLTHLATGYTVRLAQLHDVLERGQLGPEPAVDAAIAGHIARHRQSSPEAVVEEMIRQRSEVRRLLGLLRPEHLEARSTIDRPRDQAPREGPFVEALQHYHEHDLEHAVDLAPIMRRPVAPPEV